MARVKKKALKDLKIIKGRRLETVKGFFFFLKTVQNFITNHICSWQMKKEANKMMIGKGFKILFLILKYLVSRLCQNQTTNNF